MDIKLLKTFLMVAKLLNITKAAEQLSFTQPAISSQIYSLEDEFKVRLFERNGKRLALTAAGEKLVEYAERMISLYDETQNVMTSFGQRADVIRLGVSTQFINHLLPVVLLELQGRLPHLAVDVEVCMNTQEVLKGVSEYRFDLGFVHGENSLPQLRQHGVWTEKILWVANYELLRRYPPGENIAKLPLINYSEGSVFRSKLDGLATGDAFHSAIQYSDSEAIKHAVLAGLGISYLPASLVLEEVERGTLTVLPQGPPMALRVSLVHRRDKNFSVLMYALLLTLAAQPEADESIAELLRG